MALQDKNVVRTAADLEKKYNFAKLLGFNKNIEINNEKLIKVENELNNMLNSLVINLGDLLDSQSSISLWFYEGVPTTSNEPYTDWVTPSDHYGDFYYDQNSGYVYKYTNTGWILQDDENLIQAMAMTNVELDISIDHERQVYFSQPSPPYESGDWWILEDGTLMICQIGRATGDYQDDDFIIADKYTPTIASADGDIITIKQGQVIKMSDTFASFTDLATGGNTTIAGENITTGSIKSQNYIADTSGMKIKLSDGELDSKNFKINANGTVSVTGNLVATTAKLADIIVENNEIYIPIQPDYDYTQSDIDRIQEILLGIITPTQEDYAKYDFNNSGTFTLYDQMVCQRLVNYGIGYSTPGKIVFKADKLNSGIYIKGGNGTDILSISWAEVIVGDVSDNNAYTAITPGAITLRDQNGNIKSITPTS